MPVRARGWKSDASRPLRSGHHSSTEPRPPPGQLGRRDEDTTTNPGDEPALPRPAPWGERTANAFLPPLAAALSWPFCSSSRWNVKPQGRSPCAGPATARDGQRGDLCWGGPRLAAPPRLEETSCRSLCILLLVLLPCPALSPLVRQPPAVMQPPLPKASLKRQRMKVSQSVLWQVAPDATMAFPEVLLLVTALPNHGIRKPLFKTGRQKNLTLQPLNCYFQPNPEITEGKKKPAKPPSMEKNPQPAGNWLTRTDSKSQSMYLSIHWGVYIYI